MARPKKINSLSEISVRKYRVMLTKEEEEQFEIVKTGVGESTGSKAFKLLIPMYFRFESLIKSDAEQKQKIRQLELELQNQKAQHEKELKSLINKISDFTDSFSVLQNLQLMYKSKFEQD